MLPPAPRPIYYTSSDVMSQFLQPRAGVDLGVPIIYGTRRTGGIVVYQETSSDYLNLYRVYVLSEGVQQAWSLYIDDVIFASSPVQPDNLVRRVTFTGSDSGTDASSLLGDRWTSSHLCKGLAVEALDFVWTSTFSLADDGSIKPFYKKMPKIEFELTGKALTDNTGSSVSSTDPAWILYDYLTNTRYGAGISTSLIDTASFSSASTICGDTNSTSPAIKQYECNIIIEPKNSILSNIKFILSSFNASLNWIAGSYVLEVDDVHAGSVVFAFEEKHIVGGLEINASSKNEKATQITVKYTNAAKGWTADEVSWPDVNKDEDGSGVGALYNSFLSADASVPLHKTTSYSGVTSRQQARFMAKQACLRSRDTLKCKFKATSEAMNIVPSDVISVTHSTPGWTAKKFRVRSITLEMDGSSAIEAIEYNDGIYTWDYSADPAGASDTNLPPVNTVSSLSGLAFTESVYESIASGGKKVRVTLSWTASADAFIDNYDFQFKKSADSSWTDGGTTVSTSGVLNDFEKGTFDFRVRAKNSVGSVSDWVTITSQVISGVIPIPPDVVNFDVNILNGSANLTWDLPNDADVQAGGYLEIRNLQEGSTSWDDAVFLGQANPNSTNILLPLVEGNYVAKWITSDGNSSSVSFAEKGLGTVYWTNTIATFNEHPAWNGTMTGLYVADNDGDKVLKFESDGYINDFTALMDTWGTFDEQGGLETDGEYVGLTGHDLGAVFQTRVYTNKVFTSGVSDGSNYIDLWDGKIDSRTMWDETRNLSGITTYISTTEDDPNGASPTWTAWKSFLIADIKARGFKIKIKFESENSSEQFKMTELATLIDMPSRVMGASAAATTSITYADPFYAPPNLVVTPTNLGNGEYYTISSETKTGFGINFYNSADSAITRNYNYLAKGY
mgnify:CR=1 FL=1